MKYSIPKVLNTIAVIALLAVLVLVIWQPVFPSRWLIQGMAEQIDPGSLALDTPAVLRFELTGSGGGNYNLNLSRDKIDVTEGDTSQVDLLIAMNAADFNALMFKMAQGKADEFTFAKLTIDNTLKIAGDMSVLELLGPPDRGNQ